MENFYGGLGRWGPVPQETGNPMDQEQAWREAGGPPAYHSGAPRSIRAVTRSPFGWKFSKINNFKTED